LPGKDCATLKIFSVMKASLWAGTSNMAPTQYKAEVLPTGP
jgi:hypothetical protein